MNGKTRSFLVSCYIIVDLHVALGKKIVSNYMSLYNTNVTLILFFCYNLTID